MRVSLAWEKVPHPMRDIEVANNAVGGNGTVELGGGIPADDPRLKSATISNNISSRNLTLEIAAGVSPESAQARGYG